jgi:hypothetical protein
MDYFHLYNAIAATTRPRPDAPAFAASNAGNVPELPAGNTSRHIADKSFSATFQSDGPAHFLLRNGETQITEFFEIVIREKWA